MMVIRNLFHSCLINDEMFVVKVHTRRVIEVAVVDKNGDETDIFALYRNWFQFSFHGVKFVDLQFPLRSHFLEQFTKDTDRN